MSFFAVVTTKKYALGIADRTIYYPSSNKCQDGGQKIFPLGDRAAVVGIGSSAFADGLGKLPPDCLPDHAMLTRLLKELYERAHGDENFVHAATVFGFDGAPFFLSALWPDFKVVVVREFGFVSPECANLGDDFAAMMRSAGRFLKDIQDTAVNEDGLLVGVEKLLRFFATTAASITPWVGQRHDVVLIGEGGAEWK